MAPAVEAGGTGNYWEDRPHAAFYNNKQKAVEKMGKAFKEVGMCEIQFAEFGVLCEGLAAAPSPVAGLACSILDKDDVYLPAAH